MELSIVIVNYNARDQLKQCLSSIYANVEGIVFEVIVVDNASTDGSPQMVKNFFPQVRLVENLSNLGYTEANNQGIAIASGEFVLLLNNDTEILPQAVSVLVDFLRANPEVGAVASKVLNPDLTIQGTVKSFPTLLAAFFGRRSLLTKWFPRNRFSRKYLLYLSQDFTHSFEVDYVSTACLMVRREALEQAGYFDTDFFLYWSDADLCFRIKKKKWKIFCLPQAETIHHEHKGGSRATKKWSRKSIIDFNRGAYLYYRKHHVRYFWSPKNLFALLGLSANAAKQLAVSETQHAFEWWDLSFLNPAQIPSANRAIIILTLICLIFFSTLGILQSQTEASFSKLKLAKRTVRIKVLGESLITSRQESASSQPATSPPTSVDLQPEKSPPVSEYIGPVNQRPPIPVLPADSSEEPPPSPPKLAERTVSPANERIFGLSAYLLDSDRLRVKRKIELLSEAKVSWVRMDIRWDELEPTKGAWNFDRFDYALKLLAEKGIQVVGVLCYTAPWASSAPESTPPGSKIFYPPSSHSDYENFVSTVVSRYKNYISYWQMGIEPDLFHFWQPEPNPTKFVDLFKKGLAAIKKVDPPAKIVFPGLTTAQKLNFLEETLKLGVAEDVDVFAYHDYSDSPEGNLREEVSDFINLIRRYTSKQVELWFTEMGWSTYESSIPSEAKIAELFIHGIDEDTQAENIVKRLVLASELPLSYTFIWEFSDAGSDTYDILLHFGLLRENLSPKLSFNNYKALLRLLEGKTTKPTFLISASRRDNKLEQHYFINRHDELILALWNSNLLATDISLTLETDDFGSPSEVNLNTLDQFPLFFNQSEEVLNLHGLNVSGEPKIIKLTRPTFYNKPGSFSPNGDGNLDQTNIHFSLPESGRVSLRILDNQGNPVRTLADNIDFSSGNQSLIWDGRDDNNRLVGDGNYVAELTLASGILRNRITVDTHAPSVTSFKVDNHIIVPQEKNKPYFFIPISYDLSEPSSVKIDIFDEKGNFYAHLDPSEIQSKGRNKIEWPNSILNFREGTYWLRIKAQDIAGNSGAKISGSPLKIDFSPPNITALSWQPSKFSPDKDGNSDTSVLSYTLSEKADVTASVKDSAGNLFYLFAIRNQSAGPRQYAWDGKAYDPSTKSHKGLNDGIYEFQLDATDPNGNTSSTWANITIEGGDFVGPIITSLSLNPPAFSPNGDKIADTTTITYELLERANVTILAIDSNNKKYYIAAYPNQEPGSHSLAWDGKVKDQSQGTPVALANGKYLLSIEAIDRAGNSATYEEKFELEEVDLTLPSLRNASVSPSIFSPNGDGVSDTATLTYELLERADVTISVIDSNNKKYYLAAYLNQEPALHSLVWDGEAYDQSQRVQVGLADGKYLLNIELRDWASNSQIYKATVQIKAGNYIPLKLTAVSLQKMSSLASRNKRGESLRINYELSRHADVTISLKNLAGRIYYIAAFENQNPGRHSFAWDGLVYDTLTHSKTGILKGTYVYYLEARSSPDYGVTFEGILNLNSRGKP